MTDAELLARVKRRLKITDTLQDTLLSEIIADAEGLFLSYTGLSAVPEALKPAQAQFAVILFNRMGTEGESSHAEGGVSASVDTIPPDIRAQLAAYRLLRVILL